MNPEQAMTLKDIIDFNMHEHIELASAISWFLNQGESLASEAAFAVQHGGIVVRNEQEL